VACWPIWRILSQFLFIALRTYVAVDSGLVGPGRRTAPVCSARTPRAWRDELLPCAFVPSSTFSVTTAFLPPFAPDAQSRRLTLVNRRESIVLSCLVHLVSFCACDCRRHKSCWACFFILFLWCTKCTARVKGFVSCLPPASSFIAVV
jgi:hypothetical protein